MRTWLVAKQFRAWAIRLLALAVLPPLTGCADAGITVTLTSWPAGASEVRVVPSLDGTAGSEIVLGAGQSVFVVRVPQGRGSQLSLTARALDSGGCKLATGSIDQPLPGGLRPYADLALSLSALPVPTCTLTLTVEGTGTAKATWATAQGPGLLDCAAGQTCEAEFPRQAAGMDPITISAREASRREYPTIGGSCVGLHDCRLLMQRSHRVSVRMMPRQCTLNNFCLYSPLPFAVNWNGVWGAAANDIWAVGTSSGSGGVIAHFDGQAWQYATTAGKVAPLSAVWGSGPSDVWAVGLSGEIQHWNGTSWSREVATTTSHLYAVWGSSASDVWIAGEMGTIRRWNGSQFGTVASTGPSMGAAYRGIWGSGPNDVWLVGDNAWTWHYNGTVGTQVANAMTTMPLLGVWGSGPNDIWVTAGASGVGGLQHWDGSAWTVIRVLGGSEPTYSSAWGSPSGQLWIAGGAGTVLRGKGGAFSQEPAPGKSLPPSKELLRSIWGSSDSDVWMVGENGALLHWDGREVRSYSEGHSAAWNAQWGSGPDDIWLGGPKGALAHWDGVKHSPVQFGNTCCDILSIAGTSKSDVYAVGSLGLISHYNGSNWTGQVPPISGLHLQAVWATGPSDVWAGGALNTTTGGLLRKTGTQWNSVTINTAISNKPIAAIHGTSPTDLWIVRTDGELVGFDGSAFSAPTQVPLTSSQVLLSMWVAGTGQAWAAAGFGGVYRRAVRGGPWMLSAPNTSSFFYSVAGSSASEVWVTDQAGGVARWDGAAWSQSSVQNFTSVSAAFVSGPGDAWLSANNTSVGAGYLYRYAP